MKLNTEKIAALSFNVFFKIGSRKIFSLLSSFNNLSSIYNADFLDLKRAGLEESLIYDFLKWRSSFKIAPVLESLKEEGIDFCYFYENTYPQILKEIYNPPLVLYFKGCLNFNDSLSLSVVGSRNNSPYGEKVVNKIIKASCEYNLIIISGLAIGIDSIAHTKTLEHKGKTIAVLGSGLDKRSIYPRCNACLMEKIIKNKGAVISEFPLGTSPLRQNFPQRNRIIAGLSRATLIIEAKKKSGSLITAYQALNEGREVMAVPGSIFSDLSEGTNDLIARGAKIINKESDVLSFYYEDFEL